MPLKITKSFEPIEVKTIVGCLYAQPGVGKTSMAFTAEKPLLLDFDRGSYRSANRRDVVQIESWSDVTNITAEDLAPYKTLIVDTAGRALDFLTVEVIKADAKWGRGGALTLQGFGVLKTRFVSWTNLIRSFGLDVVLIAHLDEQKKGDDTSERLDIQGGSKQEVYKSADLMGRIYLSNGKRTLNFNPTDTAFGKNPAALPVFDVPDYSASPDFFAGVIAQTKAGLNKLSAEQAQVAGLLEDWKQKIDAVDGVDAFNALLDPIKAADERIRDNAKRLLAKASKAKGIVFDKEKGLFIAVAAAAPAASKEEKAEPTRAEATEAKPAAQEREPGADDEDDRKAAAPTQEEMKKLAPKKGSKAA
jgi:hypothetical protein